MISIPEGCFYRLNASNGLFSEIWCASEKWVVSRILSNTDFDCDKS